MPTPSSQPAAVLDYAAPTPHDEALRRLRGVILVLVGTLLGGGLGWMIEPRVYRAVGYLQVEPTQAGSDQMLDANGIQSRQAAAATALASPANLNAAVTLLPRTMPLKPAEIVPKLRAQKVQESRLVAVSFEHADPQTAAAVVNAVMSSYTAPGVATVAMAMPPGRPMRNKLFPLAGLAAGLLAGLFIVATRRQ